MLCRMMLNQLNHNGQGGKGLIKIPHTIKISDCNCFTALGFHRGGLSIDRQGSWPSRV